MNSSKNKFLFVSRGPGETSQARALADYVASKEKNVYFSLHQKINYSFLEQDKDRFDISIAERTNNFIRWDKTVKKVKPDVLLLFNSKMQGWSEDFKENSIKPKPITVCVDSNWLFNEKQYPWYPFIKWADKYLINIPEKIFNLGLKENGGNFKISEKIKDKIEPVGLIPSYKKPPEKEKKRVRKKYNVKNEKLIFSYFSGMGAGHRPWAFNNLIEAVELLQSKDQRIKVIYVGPIDNLDQEKLSHPWLITKDHLGIEEYYSALSSSDLIFQHQGLVTLSQAISAQVPVIANVANQPKEKMKKIHFWEVKPFAEAGVCSMIPRTDSTAAISEEIEQLLYNSKRRKSMQEQQKKHCTHGEKKAYDIIQKMLKKS